MPRYAIVPIENHAQLLQQSGLVFPVQKRKVKTNFIDATGAPIYATEEFICIKADLFTQGQEQEVTAANGQILDYAGYIEWFNEVEN